jgi:hypothetical protein
MPLALPLVVAGKIHEWFLGTDSATRHWHPPLTLMAALAAEFAGKDRIVWIGRACWPAFQMLGALQGSPGDPPGKILARSLFLDPLTDAERFWAIGQALRCPGVKAVVADAAGLSQTASRRLQLAAEAGGDNVLGLLARPHWELDAPSWAATRWLVRPRPAATPMWDIELLSRRGRQPGPEVPECWTMEWTYQVFRGTGALHLSPRVGRGAAAAAQSRAGSA